MQCCLGMGRAPHVHLCAQDHHSRCGLVPQACRVPCSDQEACRQPVCRLEPGPRAAFALSLTLTSWHLNAILTSYLHRHHQAPGDSELALELIWAVCVCWTFRPSSAFSPPHCEALPGDQVTLHVTHTGVLHGDRAAPRHRAWGMHAPPTHTQNLGHGRPPGAVGLTHARMNSTTQP